MINFVKNVITFYLDKQSIPNITDLELTSDLLRWESKSCFVTIFKNWNIRGSAWTIKELNTSLAKEIISNTVDAISRDSRFGELKKEELADIKLRLDIIKDRKIYQDKVENINPIKNWVAVIKKDYSKLSVLLPNISATVVSGKDIISVLSQKLDEEFKQDDYIIYILETEQFTDY